MPHLFPPPARQLPTLALLALFIAPTPILATMVTSLTYHVRCWPRLLLAAAIAADLILVYGPVLAIFNFACRTSLLPPLKGPLTYPREYAMHYSHHRPHGLDSRLDTKMREHIDGRSACRWDGLVPLIFYGGVVLHLDEYSLVKKTSSFQMSLNQTPSY